MMAAEAGEPHVSFDPEGGVRVLDSDKFNKSQQLHELCGSFNKNIQDFTQTVHSFLSVLQTQADQIEFHKLKAIGQRILVENEQDRRKVDARQLKKLIREREAELQRLQGTYESLLKIESEKKAMIENLSNNEA